MKTVALFFAVFFMYLGGAHAGTRHNATHHTGFQELINQHYIDNDQLPDMEDDNDDENLTRKITLPAKWLSAITATSFTSERAYPSPIKSADDRHSPGDFIILLRVLRI